MAQERVMHFEFPLPPNIANKTGSHWKARYYPRKQYFKRLDELVTVRLLPGPPQQPWEKATALVTVRTWKHRMDEDNAHSRTKVCFDWLQTRGYILNDRDVTRRVVPEVAERSAVGITLILEEAA